MMKQYKLSHIARAAMLLAVLAMLAACEKPILDDGPVDGGSPSEANVVLHFTQSEDGDFTVATRAATHADTTVATRAATRAVTNITDLCSRLNLAVFNADGTKVKTIAQKEGDASYGTVALSLAAGTYKLVVMAHNCDGSATITSTEKVSFPNNKVTDTFFYFGDLVVTAEKQTYDLTLTRAVAMVRLVLTDESIPEAVAKLKFYYVGGSSTFSPKDGYGCVNITVGGATKSYTYSTTDQLEAGYKLHISGTYTEAVGVALSGTITGAAWLGERTISFDFDENGSSASGDNTDPTTGEESEGGDDPSELGSVPAVGTIYQTCYVLSVTDNGDHADVVLLSPSETTMGDSYDNITMMSYTDEARVAAVAAAVDAKIALADVDAISDWRLPTLSELNAIYSAREAINAALDTDVNDTMKYLYDDGGTVKYRVLSDTGEGAADFGATARVRPVVTVTIAKE